MTQIAPFAAGSYSAARNTQNLLNLKTQLDTLATQLSTGKAADSYGGLGTSRGTSLSAHATLSALDGYDYAIQTAQTRVAAVSASLSQVASLTTTLRGSVTNSPLNNAATATNNAQLARNGLDAAIEALGQQLDGQYLFSGAKSDTPPVAATGTLLYGKPGADGLSQVVTEQIDANVGSGLGRLTLTKSATAPYQVNLTEESNALTRSSFGFQIGAASATGSAITIPPLGASPKTLTFQVNQQPAVGDTLTLTLNLPDGTSTTLTLQAAGTADSTSRTSFAIGATPADTATNLSGAVQRAIANEAQTTLSAAAIVQATRNFFGDPDDATIKDYNGNPSASGSAPRRIGTSPPPTGAPVYIDQLTGSDRTAPENSKTTVQWYEGETGTANARASVAVRTGATSTVQVGARADETAIREALTSFAAGALSNAGFQGNVGTDTEAARWKAVASRVSGLLPEQGNLEGIASSFSLATSALANAKAGNQSTRNALQSAVDGIENVSTEQVAAELLAVQTRLQASYQITSTLSKLTLVNYMP